MKVNLVTVYGVGDSIGLGASRCLGICTCLGNCVSPRLGRRVSLRICSRRGTVLLVVVFVSVVVLVAAIVVVLGPGPSHHTMAMLRPPVPRVLHLHRHSGIMRVNTKTTTTVRLENHRLNP